ncbi:MAG TPA: leucyl/phenylalanyl-tRNA--protein transferase [Steroidobacteraceae bacterium]|nr:leucyl/phenylalanyl-tRNA--protein transferase [Steroidobacteraceae bacterium]
MNKSITWLSPDGGDWFPPLDQALDEPEGLLAAGGDLSPARLLAAYRRGIFPWYSAGQPVLWWSPNPREVLLPAAFKCSRSLAKSIRNRGFEVAFDRDFAGVVNACAARREHSTGTWITSEMHAAYTRLHERGHAHSVEVRLDGALVGGLYGVHLGSVFFGESMFSRVTDASKVALARLVERGVVAGLTLIDCQLPTPHLRSLGSQPMDRAEFSKRVHEGTAVPDVPLFSDTGN